MASLRVVARRSGHSLVALLLGLTAAIWLLPGSASAAGRLAYVADWGANQIGILDTSTDKFKATSISGMTQPFQPQMTPDGSKLYVPLYGDNQVAAFDVNSGQIRLISVAPSPAEIAVTPDGRYVYVNSHSNLVQRIDTATGQLAGDPLTVGNYLQEMAVTPDGAELWIVNQAGGNIVMVSTATNQEVGERIQVSDWPVAIAFTPDGARAFVVDAVDGIMRVIDVASKSVVGPPIPTPAAPGSVTVSPDGETAWVVGNDESQAQAYDARTGQAKGTPLGLGSNPYDFAITPDGKKAYTANYGDKTISVFDPISRTPTTLIPDLKGPWHMTITPDQPPVARLAAPASVVAGQVASFDAGGSGDPDGTIARYDWTFGDGGSAPAGGAREEHLYTKPGSFPVAVTLTDDEGCSTEFVTAGHTAYCNGSEVAAASTTVQVKLPANGFGFGKLKLNHRKGTAVLQVRLPGPGAVRLAGKGLRPAKKAVKGAGKVALPVRPTGKVRRKLKRRRSAKVKVRVTFAPSYGKPRTKPRKLTLKRR